MIDIFSSARLKKHKLWGKYPSIQNENEVLQIKSAGNEIGEGTFAVQPIDKGDIVCEYKGKLLEVPKHLMKGKWPPDVDLVTTHGNFTFFFKTMDGKGWCLDAEDSEGFGRKINHSKKDANVRPIVLNEGENPKLFFKAMRDIFPGEQLFYPYGENDPSVIADHEWLAS